MLRQETAEQTKLFKRNFLFITSVARTNLEAEIVQRGGSFNINNLIRFRARRECIGKNILIYGKLFVC